MKKNSSLYEDKITNDSIYNSRSIIRIEYDISNLNKILKKQGLELVDNNDHTYELLTDKEYNIDNYKDILNKGLDKWLSRSKKKIKCSYDNIYNILPLKDDKILIRI